ncbi:unnamed protein product [Symbiodinium natans]|uniref:Folate receptor-like domain-containing protein n=1 Tax=Symbiodinium natans TaxID=878477 RepID=A0A812IM19_9DINO|nr:unnamed protein product [Symbiodinium natans]
MTVIRLLLLGVLLGKTEAELQCTAQLAGRTEETAGRCTPTSWDGEDPLRDWAMKCFDECFADPYLLEELPGADVDRSYYPALAYPTREACSIQGPEPALPQLLCKQVAAFRMTCSKAFQEFPNACSGGLHVQGHYAVAQKHVFLALYAFSSAIPGSANVREVLESRLVADGVSRCAGMYRIAEGNCLGLGNAERPGPAQLPPRPPVIPQMQGEFPEVNAATDNGNDFYFWLAVVVLFIMLAGATLFLSRRRNEERRRLRDSQEIEIHSIHRA